MSTPALTPATVEGTDIGSVYTVIARTENGYVAARRLSKYFYRVRAERFDKQPIITVNQPLLIAAITKLGLGIKDNGVRVTGVFYGEENFPSLCSLLTTVLMCNDYKVIQNLPEGTDAEFLNQDAKIEAKKLKHALLEEGVEAGTLPSKADGSTN